MLRKFMKVAMAGALGALAVVLATAATGGAQDKKDKKDEKVPTVKEIMQKGHKGTDAYMTKIKDAVEAGKWDEAKEYAKTLAFFGEAMGKSKQPVDADDKPLGTAASWEKLSKKYAESTKAAFKATEDKDAKAVDKALGAIKCSECHDPHRAKKKKN